MKYIILIIFKREAGPVIARLVRILGSLQAAEDAFHDAWVRALEHWPVTGVSEHPGAWVATAAKSRALDVKGSLIFSSGEPLAGVRTAIDLVFRYLERRLRKVSS